MGKESRPPKLVAEILKDDLHAAFLGDAVSKGFVPPAGAEPDLFRFRRNYGVEHTQFFLRMWNRKSSESATASYPDAEGTALIVDTLVRRGDPVPEPISRVDLTGFHLVYGEIDSDRITVSIEAADLGHAAVDTEVIIP